MKIDTSRAGFITLAASRIPIEIGEPDFERHVHLIAERDGLDLRYPQDRGAARARAWLEGPQGLAKLN